MRGLGGGPELVEGQGLAVVPQGVLLQLTDGHGGERAGQALVRVLLTCSKKSKSLYLTYKRAKKGQIKENYQGSVKSKSFKLFMLERYHIAFAQKTFTPLRHTTAADL